MFQDADSLLVSITVTQVIVTREDKDLNNMPMCAEYLSSLLIDQLLLLQRMG